MTKFTYILFLVVFVIVYTLIRILFFNEEFSFEAISTSLLAGVFTVIIIYFIERVRNKDKKAE